MSKFLLALSILSVSAGGFLAARKSASQFQREADAAREVLIQQTQLVAEAQGQQAELTEQVRELREALGRAQPVEENSLWSALQTNQKNQLTPAQLERLLEELGFNWQSSPDFIVITKQSLRDAGTWMFRNGKCSEMDAAVLAMTPEERGQVEAAMQRLRTEFNDWVLARVERSARTNGITAEYISPDSALLQSATTEIDMAVARALRRNRAELIGGSWWLQLGLGNPGYQTSMVIARELAGDQQRLKVEMSHFNPGEISLSPRPDEIHEIRISPEGVRTSHYSIQSGYLPEFRFPEAFRCTFPNGWADVAEREGFELPKEAQKK